MRSVPVVALVIVWLGIVNSDLCLLLVSAAVAADIGPMGELKSSAQRTSHDLEWTKWVRVSWWAGNAQPAWLDRDAARQYALDTLQPDIVDWYQGLDMDRGQFFRKRGVAVSTGSSWEYDQDFAMQTDGPGFSREHFLGNGIEQNEDGSPVFQENWQCASRLSQAR